MIDEIHRAHDAEIDGEEIGGTRDHAQLLDRSKQHVIACPDCIEEMLARVARPDQIETFPTPARARWRSRTIRSRSRPLVMP